MCYYFTSKSYLTQPPQRDAGNKARMGRDATFYNVALPQRSQMTKKDEVKIQAYLKEFPWLTKYVRTEAIGELKVSRIDFDSLDTSPHYEMIAYDPIGPARHAWENIYLLDKIGAELAEVGVIPAVPNPNFRWWKFWTWSSNTRITETINDTLVRLGSLSGEVQIALHLSHNGWRHNIAMRQVTIYKGPKGFNLKNWGEQLQREAENTLKQQIKTLYKEDQS